MFGNSPDVTENEKIGPKTRADDIKSDEFDRKIRESLLVDSEIRN
jgi:hypothetical protein